MDSKIIFAIISASLLFSCTESKKEVFQIPDLTKWDDRKIEYLTSDDGIKLAYRQLIPENPKKALVLIPGATTYGYYLIPLMEEIYRKNILVRITDLRGHGDSEGTRGDTPDSEALINDLRRHISDIESKYNGIEIFIGGHSMGAGICGKYTEKYKNDKIRGVIYIAPFFHYSQSGVKNSGFVQVDMFKLFFGKEHEITHIYHPAGNDPKLVKTYTKIMSKASMVENYNSFRKDNSINSLLIIGKKDELFEWNKLLKDFHDNPDMKKTVLENETHLGIIFHSVAADVITEWINQ